MSEVTKDQMLMRADDIEDILNDVFARNMPELQEEEELGMGFGKEIFEMSKYKELGTILDMENKELEDVYLPPSNPRPFVEPRKEIWMDDELGKADPEVQKRLTEIMLTRKVKPKGETK